MKSFVIVSTLVVTCAIASADPDSYVSTGAAEGAHFGPYVAATFEGGHRLGDSSWWLHGMFDDGSGMMHMRAGVESRGCSRNGVVCAVGGFDAALEHTDRMTDEGMIQGNVPLVFTRLGLDVGSKHVRARASFDIGFWEYIPADLMATAAVAYQW